MLKRSSTVWHLLTDLLQALDQPKLLQKRLEFIALRHMNADITTADIEAFRNILLEVCASRLGGLMTPELQFSMGQVVVAVGTSLANTHEHYAARLKLFTSCWKEVNAEDVEAADQPEATATEEGEGVEAEGKHEVSKEQTNVEQVKNNTGMEKEGDQKSRGKCEDNSNMNVPCGLLTLRHGIPGSLRRWPSMVM